MYAFATAFVVVAFIATVVFVPSDRPARRLATILRAWRHR